MGLAWIFAGMMQKAGFSEPDVRIFPADPKRLRSSCEVCGAMSGPGEKRRERIHSQAADTLAEIFAEMDYGAERIP